MLPRVPRTAKKLNYAKGRCRFATVHHQHLVGYPGGGVLQDVTQGVLQGQPGHVFAEPLSEILRDPLHPGTHRYPRVYTTKQCTDKYIVQSPIGEASFRQNQHYQNNSGFA